MLVWNMRVKYGVLDADLYTFDETGFMMGTITPSTVVTKCGSTWTGKYSLTWQL